MKVDAHIHAFPRFAGMSKGRPVVSDTCGRVRHGNEIVQFLPPSFRESASTVKMMLAHLDASGVQRAVLLSNVVYGYHNDYSAAAVAAQLHVDARRVGDRFFGEEAAQ